MVRCVVEGLESQRAVGVYGVMLPFTRPMR
jgi:hypothetical protein